MEENPNKFLPGCESNLMNKLVEEITKTKEVTKDNKQLVNKTKIVKSEVLPLGTLAPVTISKAIEPLGTLAPSQPAILPLGASGAEVKAELEEVMEQAEATQHLTIKQRKWLALYLESGNATSAALQVYDTDNYFTAASIGSENLKKLQSPFKFLLDYKGLTSGKIAEKLAEGLNSTTESYKGNTIPDYHARHKYLQSLAKWSGIEQEAQQLTQINIGEGMGIEFIEIKPEDIKRT